MRKIIVAALLVLLSTSGFSSAAEDGVFEIETEGSYRMAAGSSVDLAKKVALFAAKRKAVELAGRYLSRNSLIKTYKLDKEEIYSLAAREIQAKIVEEKWETVGKNTTCRLRIRVRVQASDFIKAEIADNAMEEDEAKKPYREEVEQHVSSEIAPGKEIARAYLFLREKKWRIAVIYLDHLEEKYPNWDSIYMAKAIAYYIMQNPVFMEKALNKACRLGNQTACGDIKNLKRVHEQDFGLSIKE